MDNIREKLQQAVRDAEQITISNKTDKQYQYRKITVAPVIIKDRIQYQISCYTDKQVFQKNVDSSVLVDRLFEHFPEHLCQINIFTEDREYSFRMTKKGKLLQNVRRIPTSDTEKITYDAHYNRRNCSVGQNGHNRKKNYILQEGMIIPPLVDMGIFTKEGKIVKSMYDKFKQINRFIEMVDDVLKDETKEELHIIDFGCGKSYLTFVIYYYLVELKGKKADIIGLDLKADVIEKCNQTADKYGYKGLRFELGDINGYHSDMPVDMVVTLHACDTATDYALYNAVNWNARYILSVPCCQHEVNGQIDSNTLAPMMKYGIIKERLSALATDAVRGCMLEYRGYRTQLLEFVDFAHSPKNILIRAVRANVSREKREKALMEVEKMCGELGIKPSIVKLLM
ncbi:MAG: class I SAM-dependent methyltransferase [Wujia sp.]